jgi:hypothetical protein
MDGIPVMLVGNKCDEESGKREVSKKTGEALQVKRNINYRVCQRSWPSYAKMYCVFQGFSKAKFAYGGSILSSSQFLILPQLPQKMKLTSKVVKIDPKIIVLLTKI